MLAPLRRPRSDEQGCRRGPVQDIGASAGHRSSRFRPRNALPRPHKADRAPQDPVSSEPARSGGPQDAVAVAVPGGHHRESVSGSQTSPHAPGPQEEHAAPRQHVPPGRALQLCHSQALSGSTLATQWCVHGLRRAPLTRDTDAVYTVVRNRPTRFTPKMRPAYLLPRDARFSAPRLRPGQRCACRDRPRECVDADLPPPQPKRRSRRTRLALQRTAIRWRRPNVGPEVNRKPGRAGSSHRPPRTRAAPLHAGHA